MLVELTRRSRGKNHKDGCGCRLCNVPRGEGHWNWRDSSAAYNSIHAWVERELGKPKVCNICKTTTAKKFEWSNISGFYHRDFKDWIRLCTKCHVLVDGRFGNGSGKTKYTVEQLQEIISMYSRSESPTIIMKKTGVSKSHYYRIIKNKARVKHAPKC